MTEESEMTWDFYDFHIVLIIIMSIFGGIITGAIVGFYFAEKNVPFPLTYHPRTQGHTGYLTLALQIIDTISRDVK